MPEETMEEGASSAPKLTLTVNHFSTTLPAPSQAKNEQDFACPLCVRVFKKFAQLEWHLLSMHPRRDMIMKLVQERYGFSQMDVETAPSETLESQNPQEAPSTCSETAEKLEPVAVGTGTTTDAFKIPLKLRHKAAASAQIKSDRTKTTCKELAENSKEHQCRQKMTPEESSSWESYISFCLSRK